MKILRPCGVTVDRLEYKNCFVSSHLYWQVYGQVCDARLQEGSSNLKHGASHSHVQSPKISKEKDCMKATLCLYNG